MCSIIKILGMLLILSTPILPVINGEMLHQFTTNNGDISNGDFELYLNVSIGHHVEKSPQTSGEANLIGSTLVYNVTKSSVYSGLLEGSEIVIEVLNEQIDGWGRIDGWGKIYTTRSYVLAKNNVTWNDQITFFEGSLIPIYVLYPMQVEVYSCNKSSPILRIPPDISGLGISVTNYSQFDDLSSYLQGYGYLNSYLQGYGYLNSILDSSFTMIEDLNDAYEYWSKDINSSGILVLNGTHVAYNCTIEKQVAWTGESDLNLTFTIPILEDIEGESIDIIGNIRSERKWNDAGILKSNKINILMDNSGADSELEDYVLEYELVDKRVMSPNVSVGDKGIYTMDTDLTLAIDLPNKTLETLIKDNIRSLLEFDNLTIFNYTITAFDGLYYTVDGYLLNVTQFIGDRIVSLSNTESSPPPIESYYTRIPSFIRIEDVYFDTAISVLDGSTVLNLTKYYYVYSGEEVTNEDGTVSVTPLKAFNTTSIRLTKYPGIKYCYIFEKDVWNSNFNGTMSIQENLERMIEQNLLINNGSVEYQLETMDAWNFPNNPCYFRDKEYLAVLEMSIMPGTGYKYFFSPDYPIQPMRNGAGIAFLAMSISPPDDSSDLESYFMYWPIGWKGWADTNPNARDLLSDKHTEEISLNFFNAWPTRYDIFWSFPVRYGESNLNEVIPLTYLSTNQFLLNNAMVHSIPPMPYICKESSILIAQGKTCESLSNSCESLFPEDGLHGDVDILAQGLAYNRTIDMTRCEWDFDYEYLPSNSIYSVSIANLLELVVLDNITSQKGVSSIELLWESTTTALWNISTCDFVKMESSIHITGLYFFEVWLSTSSTSTEITTTPPETGTSHEETSTPISEVSTGFELISFIGLVIFFYKKKTRSK